MDAQTYQKLYDGLARTCPPLPNAAIRLPLPRCEITASLSTDANGQPHDRYAEITIWTGKSRLRCLGAFLVAHHARPHASLRMIWRGQH